MVWWIVLIVVVIAVAALVVRGRRSGGAHGQLDPSQSEKARWKHDGSVGY